MHAGRSRTLSRRPSRRLSALGVAWLTRTTAAPLALCALEPPHVAKTIAFAKVRPRRRRL